MAQHDMIIDNAAGAEFRADINDALTALVTLNSGTAEPIATFANMLWYDSALQQLKIRNDADTDWVVLTHPRCGRCL